jgi:hypothetical protein
VRNEITALFLGALLCAPAIAQNAPPASASEPSASQPQPSTPAGHPPSAATQPAASANNPLKIAPGSVIPVQLQKTVDAKKAKTGDEVVATVTQDMKTNSGDVLVPKDTKILGHVTTAQARNKEQKQSELAIAFDHAVVKGDQMPLPMSIQAVVAPQPANPAEGGSDQGNAPPQSGSSGSPMAGRTPTGGMSQSPQQPSNYPPGEGSTGSQPQTNARPPITGNTQGVIGMPDVKLETTAQNTAQGSLMTSEKNNVKIEKGTMLLLRVN